MVRSSPPPPLLLAVALLAAPSARALQVKPTPPPHPPKSLPPPSSVGRKATAASPPAVWNRGDGRGTPLRAYTAAESHHRNPWLPLLKFPKSFAELFEVQDSLLSFEGGSAPKAAARPLMPNLEVETAAMTAAAEKEEVLSELAALTKTFDDLQSSMDYKSQLYSETIGAYESKIEGLEEQNALLKKGFSALTASTERQKEQIRVLQEKEEARGATKNLEEENETLRKRLRFLEVELSDIAFESRKTAAPEPAVTAKVEAAAPSPPAPPHVFQQRRMEQLQWQVEEYERERSSVRKLFGLGLRRGASKVGRALNLWNPVYNLVLWGKMKGQMM